MGIRGFGETCAQAFEQAGLALTAVVADTGVVEPRVAVPIDCAAPDAELLFADWLNSLIYEMSTRRMLFAHFDVRIDGQRTDGMRLHATAWGEGIDPSRHRLAVEIKGATYTALRVARVGGEWLAQTVVDV